MDMVYKDDKTTLSDDEIVGLLIALLFAGQHTSSITSTWTAMFLLFNPTCLEKVITYPPVHYSQLHTLFSLTNYRIFYSTTGHGGADHHTRR